MLSDKADINKCVSYSHVMIKAPCRLEMLSSKDLVKELNG